MLQEVGFRLLLRQGRANTLEAGADALKAAVPGPAGVEGPVQPNHEHLPVPQRKGDFERYNMRSSSVISAKRSFCGLLGEQRDNRLGSALNTVDSV